MKKLLLINPVGRASGYLLSKFSTIPPLSLAYIAAVTPSGWEVKIADENFERFVFELSGKKLMLSESTGRLRTPATHQERRTTWREKP